MKKHILLIGVIVSVTFFIISATYYPGGSQRDKNAIGYDWRHNYLCNLVSEKAVNGADNTPTRVLAIAGMLCLCVSLSLFLSVLRIKFLLSNRLISLNMVALVP